LYVVGFAYSLLSLVAVLPLVVLVVTFLPYETDFTSTHEFSLLSISPPHSASGEGEG